MIFSSHDNPWIVNTSCISEEQVFQRRLNGSVDFYRNWLEYVNGFGDVDSEYWLGLRHLHRLTHADLMEVLIYLEDFEDNSRYARYNFFAVSSEYTDFRLDIGSYHGDAGKDCLLFKSKHISK